MTCRPREFLSICAKVAVDQDSRHHCQLCRQPFTVVLINAIGNVRYQNLTRQQLCYEPDRSTAKVS